LGNALTSAISRRRENLDPFEIGVRKAPFDHAPRRLRRDALPRCTRPHPVAEIRDTRRLVDPAEPARAEKPSPVEDPELKARAVLAAAQCRPDPLLGVVQRIRRLAPVHPAADLDARLVYGAKHGRRVPHLERTYIDPRLELRKSAEDQRRASSR